MKILWVGDAVVKTGFEYVSRGFLTQLKDRGWDIVHLGIGATGDPHDYPWKVYPAASDYDYIGVRRLPGIVEKEKPDVVVISNDAWAVPQYLDALDEAYEQSEPARRPEVVAYCPVDSLNQPHASKFKDRVSLAMAPTQFGVDELVKGGYEGKTAVVGYGIDVSSYAPDVSTKDARVTLKMPPVLQEAFIVGNVNRNAPRKRIDLTMRAFADFARGKDDAYLLLHMAAYDSFGWNLPDMAKYYGISDRLILTGGKRESDYVPFEKLRMIYRAIDVQVSTTVGEGWGLTTAEGMASGVAQWVPRYSALGEWADGGVTYYDVDDTQMSTGQINTVWAVPDIDHLVSWLTMFAYRDRDGLRRLSAKALTHISQPKFSWSAVGQQMHEALEALL